MKRTFIIATFCLPLFLAGTAGAQTLVIVQSASRQVTYWNNVSTVPLISNWQLDAQHIDAQGWLTRSIQSRVFYQGTRPDMINTVYFFDRYKAAGELTDFWQCFRKQIILRHGQNTNGTWIYSMTEYVSVEPFLELNSGAVAQGQYTVVSGLRKYKVMQSGGLHIHNGNPDATGEWIMESKPREAVPFIVTRVRVGPGQTTVWSPPLSGYDWISLWQKTGPSWILGE